MAFQVPSADELKRIARANHIELTAEELAALEDMMPGQMAILEQIDAIAPTPQDSVTRYRDRKAGVRPSPKDDPLNAIVTRCSVKGAAEWSAQGQARRGEGQRVRRGNSGERRIVGVEGSRGGQRRDDRCADARRGRGNRRDAEHGRLRAVRRRPHQLLRTGAQSAQSRNTAPAVRRAARRAALYYDDIDLTIGTDQGGSIRIPASWSGVVGIKPTYGLVPYTGVMSIDPTLDHVGPMARSVSDVALLLEVLAGKDPLDPRQREVTTAPYREALGKSLGRNQAGSRARGLHAGGRRGRRERGGESRDRGARKTRRARDRDFYPGASQCLRPALRDRAGGDGDAGADQSAAERITPAPTCRSSPRTSASACRSAPTMSR